VRWLVLLVIACSSNAPKHDDAPTTPMPVRDSVPASPSPTVTFQTDKGDITVQSEVVSTPAAIQKGLMFRENLPPDAGMLFLMGREEDWAFYMRNTLIPLDMIFITREMTVAGVAANAKPRDETNLRVGKPSLYVLEVNGGWAAAHGVVAGTKVRFERVRAE
jgi:uncharacterized protein